MKNIIIITILLILSTPIAFGQSGEFYAQEAIEESKVAAALLRSLDATSYKDKHSHLNPTELDQQARRDAQDLRRALYSPWLDTDEDTAWRIFKETSAKYRNKVRAIYNDITPRNHTLSDGLYRLGFANGDDVLKGRLLFKYGTLTPLDRMVMSSNQDSSTDEDLLMRELVMMDHSPKALEKFEDDWKKRYAPGGTFRNHISGNFSTFKEWAQNEDNRQGWDDSIDNFLTPDGTITKDAADYMRDKLGYPPLTINKWLAHHFAQNKAPGERRPGETLKAAIKRLYDGKLNELKGGLAPSPDIGERELKCGPKGLGYRLCIPILGRTEVKDISDYIILIYRFALAISGILAFIMVTWGGIKWTVSGGNVSQIEEAKDIIKSAIFGLILLALATTILYVIDPSILQMRIDRSTLTVENIKTPNEPARLSVPSAE